MNKYRNIGLALLTLLATACAEDQIKENGLLEEAPGGEENISATNPYWSWVGSFPGWISSYEKRLELTSVEINGVYEKMDANNRIGFQQSPWISTGFYAAPGEPVTNRKTCRVIRKNQMENRRLELYSARNSHIETLQQSV